MRFDASFCHSVSCLCERPGWLFHYGLGYRAMMENAYGGGFFRKEFMATSDITKTLFLHYAIPISLVI